MSLLKDDPIKFMDMLSDDGVFILDGAFGTVINQINNKEENSIQDPLWGSR
jgi:methionine synthase I (cobalamin-dependent)